MKARCTKCDHIIERKELTFCPMCGTKFKFDYKRNWLGKTKPIICPMADCRCTQYTSGVEEKLYPGKTKTVYKANLNPFKPFTLMTAKDKVIRKDVYVTSVYYICARCHHKFY